MYMIKVSDPAEDWNLCRILDSGLVHCPQLKKWTWDISVTAQYLLTPVGHLCPWFPLFQEAPDHLTQARQEGQVHRPGQADQTQEHPGSPFHQAGHWDLRNRRDRKQWRIQRQVQLFCSFASFIICDYFLHKKSTFLLRRVRVRVISTHSPSTALEAALYSSSVSRFTTSLRNK